MKKYILRTGFGPPPQTILKITNTDLEMAQWVRALLHIHRDLSLNPAGPRKKAQHGYVHKQDCQGRHSTSVQRDPVKGKKVENEKAEHPVSSSDLQGPTYICICTTHVHTSPLLTAAHTK